MQSKSSIIATIRFKFDILGKRYSVYCNFFTPLDIGPGCKPGYISGHINQPVKKIRVIRYQAICELIIVILVSRTKNKFSPYCLRQQSILADKIMILLRDIHRMDIIDADRVKLVLFLNVLLPQITVSKPEGV